MSVSIHPGCREKEKHRSISRLKSFSFSPPCVYVLIPVLRVSPEREQRREGGGEDGGKRKKEGRHAIKKKAKPVAPAFQCFSEDVMGKVGVGRKGAGQFV